MQLNDVKELNKSFDNLEILTGKPTPQYPSVQKRTLIDEWELTFIEEQQLLKSFFVVKTRKKYVHSSVNQEHKHLDRAELTLKTPLDDNQYTLMQKISFPYTASVETRVQSNILNPELVYLIKESFNSFDFIAFTYLNNLEYAIIKCINPRTQKECCISVNKDESRRFNNDSQKIRRFLALNREKKLKYISNLDKNHRTTYYSLYGEGN